MKFSEWLRLREQGTELAPPPGVTAANAVTPEDQQAQQQMQQAQQQVQTAQLAQKNAMLKRQNQPVPQNQGMKGGQQPNQNQGVVNQPPPNQYVTPPIQQQPPIG